MSLNDYLPLDGTPTGVSDGHVYLKRSGNKEAFVWGGKCMRISGDIDTDLGSATITTRQSVSGGVERDAIREGAPGQTTFSLEMKDSQANRFKTLLRECWWVIDKRTHCNGMNRDAWNEWDQINRSCPAKSDGRTLTGTDWESPDGEVMAAFPMMALENIDLYRLTGVAHTVDALAASVTDIDSAQPARCANNCDDQEDCIVQAVTTLVFGLSPVLLTNLAGGDPDSWVQTSLTEWTTGDADFVVALRNFVLIGSTVETAILYSDNMGTNRVEIDQTAVTDWTTNPPTCGDGIDQVYLLIGGENGYVYKSVDAARTWRTQSSGQATDQNLTAIMIARDDTNVAYAVGLGNAFIKTENGGDDWYPLTGPSAADGLLDLLVISRNHVLVWNDDGELHETTDGGLTWTQQAPPATNLAATATAAGFASCACEEMMTIVSDGTNNLVLRSVYGGASGFWYQKIGQEWPGTGGFLDGVPAAVTCCGPNRYIIGGGGGTTAWFYLLTA